MQFTATIIAIHRDNYRDKFAIHRSIYKDKSVSENDAIFCNPKYWIAKNGIVFAYSNSKN
ncbi:MAG: hypothetical protein EBU46_08505 [Nitrosomonadaceae bacterium]|nr:hypothetical protein [Nitrosomonadaceae bacterium]